VHSERRSPATYVAACFAIGLVTLVVTFLVMTHRTHTMSWGEEILKTEHYVWIEGETLTQEDLEFIAGIRQLRTLELINCNVAECRLPELTFASKKLYRLELDGTKGLWDLSFLADLPIESLSLVDCPGVSEIPQLNWDTVRELKIDGTDVEDLSPLVGKELEILSFAHTDVSDISALAGMDALWEVDGSYTNVRSLDALTGLDRIWGLCFDGCPIRSLKEPFSTWRLYEVSLADTPVKDLSGLKGCDSLRTLDVGGCKRLSDLSWLDRANYETLTILDVSGTKLTMDDLGWLGSAKSLEELTLDGIALDNLDFCRRLPELRLLSCVGCGITNLAGLSRCEKLETVLLAHNELESLEGLPTLDDEWPSLLLDVSHNQLKSVRDLPKGPYRMLLLQGNATDIGRTLGPDIVAECVSVPWFAGIDDTRLANRDDIYYLYLTECPEEEVSKLDIALGAWRYRRVSENELLQLIEDDDMRCMLRFDTAHYAACMRELNAQEEAE